jgi:Domain of unknown function (DUF6933)
MVILRPTRKLRSLLPATVTVLTPSDTALGDWYVNRIVTKRQPLLLLVSSTSLLPVVMPARDVRSLPDCLGVVVASRLRRFGIEPDAIEAELQAMRPVVVAPTVNRSVLGIMVDFAKAIPYYSGDLRTDEGLVALEDWLAQTPCHAALTGDQVVFPNCKAPEMLRATWLADRPLQSTSGARAVVD